MEKNIFLAKYTAGRELHLPWRPFYDNKKNFTLGKFFVTHLDDVVRSLGFSSIWGLSLAIPMAQLQPLESLLAGEPHRQSMPRAVWDI